MFVVTNHLLYIDAGNSAIKWALSSADTLSEMVSLSYPEKISSEIFIDVWKQVDKPIRVVASSVGSEIIWQAITEACNELWNIDVQRVSSIKQGYGLINAYDKPSDLGSDRWCAMIGAYHEVKSAFMLVDAGSAITIDVVNELGQHMGGYITPGLTMMKQSLGVNTAQITVAATDKSLGTSLLPASSTAECVTAGIYLSAVKLIEGIFEKESKNTKDLKCILAGGDANLIADLLSLKYVIIPDVVLRGLAETQKENQE